MARLYVYCLEGGTHRYLVAAGNVREATPLLNCTAGYFRRYGHRVKRDAARLAVALSEPGRVFRQKIDYGPRLWPWFYADAPKD